MSNQPVRAASVQAEKVDWLAEKTIGKRFPRGMITIVAGRPDQGKGLFSAMLAAQVSQAGGRVLYSAAEDSMGLMTRPRLEAAGADLNNVLLWRFRLPDQGVELAQVVINEKIDLIIMDPFAAHLGRGTSRFSDNIRDITNPLTELIESTGTACVIIEHALKRITKGGHVLDVIGGNSSGLPAAARAAYVFGKDPDDDEKRILAPAKFNIGPWPKALALELDTEPIEPVGEVPYLDVDDELSVFDPMRLFVKDKDGDVKVGRPADKRQEANEWLTVYLAENGATLSSTIQEDAKQAGMSVKTLRRAAADMEVVKNPPKGGPKCVWDLNDDVKDAMGLPTGKPDPSDESTPGEYQPDGEVDGEDAVLTDDDINSLLGGDGE